MGTVPVGIGQDSDHQDAKPKFSGLRSHFKQITSSVDPNVDWSDYLPIYPSRKNQRTGIQLHLRSSCEEWTELYRRSYARVDTECIFPIQILKRTPEEGLQELQSKSRQAVQRYLNRRSMQAALVQAQSFVQMQTVIQEAEEESEPPSGAADSDPSLQSRSITEM